MTAATAEVIDIGKVCTRCGVRQALDQFPKRSGNGYTWYTGKCRDCLRADGNRWREQNPEKVAEFQKRSSEMRRKRVLEKRGPRVQIVNSDGRICITCKVRKPLDEFSGLRGAPGGVAYSCKPCANRTHAEWRKKNADVVKRKGYDAHVQRTYGLTTEQIDGMIRAQGGACAICHLPFSPQKKSVVDHCHGTGIVRGILCRQCNSGLGFFRDNMEALASAIEYLLVEDEVES